MRARHALRDGVYINVLGVSIAGRCALVSGVHWHAQQAEVSNLHWYAKMSIEH